MEFIFPLSSIKTQESYLKKEANKNKLENKRLIYNEMILKILENKKFIYNELVLKTFGIRGKYLKLKIYKKMLWQLF